MKPKIVSCMNVLKVCFILLLIGALLTLNATAQEAERYKLKTIVIDPGHGGDAPGAVYGSFREKQITLSIALKFGAMIKKYFPSVNVIYTRQTDVAVDLSKRGDIANKNKADLFISIHVNSSKSTSARGSETFVMGFDKSKANLDVAIKENSVISYESDYETKYEGFDPTSPESYIIFSLMQYAYLEQSSVYASCIQKHFSSSLPTPSRGVKQDAFLVLWKTAMPSVLTEVGFLSNVEDRKFLTNEQGQTMIAKSLFNAFVDYKRSVEIGTSAIAVPDQMAPTKSLSDEKTDNGTAKPTESKTTNTNSRPTILFKVQVRSSVKKVAINQFNFGKYKTRIEEKRIDGRYKYFVGSVKTYKEALSLQREIRAGNFRDAFVVPFKDGQPIGMKEALEQIDKTKK